MIELAVNQARKTMNEKKGGPFGALITDKDGNIITVSSNTVLASYDASAHAEINAIRQAGQILKTHDLSDCILYTTSYPCSMCLSAIIWANIKTVYYGATADDAAKIGFRDEFIYDFIKKDCKDKDTLELIQLKDTKECVDLFFEYQKNNHEMY